MPEKQQAKKKTTKSRRGPGHLARWLANKDRNLLRRATRVYLRHMRLARVQRARGTGTGEHHESLARSLAQRCASAHGPVVEAGFVRWLRERATSA